MENKTTKCIIMSRVSTNFQELDIQEEECINLALADGYSKENMILVPRKGESARKIGEIITVETPRGPLEIELDRDGIWDMKKRIETDSQIDCVYIWEVSRLARRMEVLTSLLKYFADRQIQLIVKTNGIRYLNDDKSVNPASKMTLEILGELAEQEMDIKIKRFKRSKKAMAEQGQYAGGKIPYGYRVDKEHGSIFVIDDYEASIVHEIFNLYESGFTQTRIAEEFYHRGKFEINLTKVNNILTNEQYTGRPVKNGWSSYYRSYPIIISSEQFDHCRKIALENNTFANKCRNIYYAHKLIVCRCGRFWGAGPSKLMYRCSEAYRSGHVYEVHEIQCTYKHTMSINIMDSILWKLAQDAEVEYILNLAAEDKAKYQERIRILDEKLSYIVTRLKEQDNKKSRVVESYIDGHISKEVRDTKFKIIDDERRKILKEQASYNNEKEHLISLLMNLDSRFYLDEVDTIVTELERIIKLKEHISNITDDKERYDIIHRHIRKVTIENRIIEYKFKVRKTKTSKTRFITVTFYNGNKRYFHFLPFDGGMRTVLEAKADGVPIQKFEFEYLQRFVDEKKIERRKKEKTERIQRQAERFPEDKYIISFDKLKDFLGIKEKMTYKLVNHGFLGPAKEILKGRAAAFNKEKCIELVKAEAENNKVAKKILDHLIATSQI